LAETVFEEPASISIITCSPKPNSSQLSLFNGRLNASVPKYAKTANRQLLTHQTDGTATSHTLKPSQLAELPPGLYYSCRRGQRQIAGSNVSRLIMPFVHPSGVQCTKLSVPAAPSRCGRNWSKQCPSLVQRNLEQCRVCVPRSIFRR
jgi:hypothetical protein